MSKRHTKRERKRRDHNRAGGGTRKLRTLAEHCAVFDVSSLLRALAALSLDPRLQMRILRIEVLQAAALSGRQEAGGRPIAAVDLVRLFALAGGDGIAMQEDPPSDLRESLCVFRGRGYRVPGGGWLDSVFQLQTVLDTLEAVRTQNPEGAEAFEGGPTVDALAAIDACMWSLPTPPALEEGEVHPTVLPLEWAERAIAYAGLFIVQPDSHAKLGERARLLRVFGQSADNYRGLGSVASDALLHHAPWVRVGAEWIFSRPTSVAHALMRANLVFLGGLMTPADLQAAIADSIVTSIDQMPSRIVRIKRRVADVELDTTRLQLVEADAGGTPCWVAVSVGDLTPAGLREDAPPVEHDFEAVDLILRDLKSETPAGAPVLCLMVGMGQMSIAGLMADRGDLVVTTAESLHVLGRLEDFAIDDLFAANLLNAKLQERGMTLSRLSGDLSVFGMLRTNQFRLISVLERQGGRAPQEAGFIEVDDSFGLGLRLEAAARSGRRVVADPEGTPHVLERYTGDSYFRQSGRFTAFFAPPLAELSRETPRICGLLEAEGFSLWWECRWIGAKVLDEARSRGFVQLWQSFLSWILRLGAGVMDEPPTGDRSTLHWVLEVAALPSRVPAEDTEAGTRFVASWSNSERTALVRLDDFNVEALCLSTNEGELDLLEAFNRGTRDREGVEVLPASALEAFRNTPRAKMFHTPTTAIVGDRAATRPRPIIGRVSDARAALAELGLGFVGGKQTARTIEGKKPVASFLKGRVEFLADRIIMRLAGLDRVRTVQRLLEHLVAKQSEAQQDAVTTAATLAAYGDDHDAEVVLRQRWQDRSAVSLIPRLLVEVAICEAVAEGGSAPTQGDLLALFADMDRLVQLSHAADAVHWGAAPAEVRVDALGGIHMSSSFNDGVMRPFVNAFVGQETRSHAERPEDHYRSHREPEPEPFDELFVEAWEAEFGVSLEACVAINRALTDLAVADRAWVLRFNRAALLDSLRQEVDASDVDAFINSFALESRENWKDPPVGTSFGSIAPWSYRRTHSLVFRPLVDLGPAFAEPLWICPDLLQQGLTYRLHRLLIGEYDPEVMTSKPMKKWIGRARNEAGKAFNQEAAEALRSLGWKTRDEVELPELLNRKFKEDMGDVDVLASHAATGRVLVVEAKNLLFAKTAGEMARQLHEFRGKLDAKQKPDRLLQHLRRVAALREDRAGLERTLGHAVSSVASVLLTSHDVPLHHAMRTADTETRFLAIEDIKQLRLVGAEGGDTGKP